MPYKVDLYWSVRSPYSYLAVRQLASLRRTWDFDVIPRIVLPIMIRDPKRVARVGDPDWVAYMRKDAERTAQMLGIPYVLPDPDPVVLEPDGSAAAEQPYIVRLARLSAAACEMGRGLSFIDELGDLVWSGGNWTDPDAQADAAARAGLDLEDLDRAITRAPDRFDALLEENGQALAAAGHWGVPTMVFEGEPFFGQDRIPVLLWRLKQKGMGPRG